LRRARQLRSLALSSPSCSTAERLVEVLPHLVEVAEHLMLLLQIAEFAFAEPAIRSSPVLEAQELEPLRALAFAVGESSARRSRTRPRRLQRSCELAPQIGRSGERVERLALDLGPHQRARVALAVDLEQQRAELAQAVNVAGRPPMRTRVLALAVDDARDQQQVVSTVPPHSSSHEALDRGAAFALAEPELAVDLQFVRAVANERTRHLLAAQQLERSDQQGLAAAGLARDHGQALRRDGSRHVRAGPGCGCGRCGAWLAVGEEAEGCRFGVVGAT
jgi:hypothetical protein